jgi:hypothetical protein
MTFCSECPPGTFSSGYGWGGCSCMVYSGGGDCGWNHYNGYYYGQRAYCHYGCTSDWGNSYRWSGNNYGNTIWKCEYYSDWNARPCAR